MNYETTDTHELSAIIMLMTRLNQIKAEEKEIKKQINRLKEDMEKNVYDRKITIKCKGLASDELQYIYRFLNELTRDDDRIEYSSNNLEIDKEDSD